MSALELLAVCVAGGVGAGLRFLVDRVVMRRARRHRFPVGILIVNVTGSFALGLLVGAGTALMPSALLTILGTGLLGGYTTFSTVSAESVLLMRTGETRRGWINALGTLVLGVAAAAAGLVLGNGL